MLVSARMGEHWPRLAAEWEPREEVRGLLLSREQKSLISREARTHCCRASKGRTPEEAGLGSKASNANVLSG